MKDQKHKEGYNIPKGYFKEFENRLFIRLNSDTLPNDPGFKVPVGFFDEVDKSILAQCNNPQKTKVKSIISKKTWLYAASIAACSIIIFSIFNNNPNEFSMKDIELSSIETYLEEGNIEIDIYDIATLFTEEELKNTPVDDYLISEDALENYLLENINDSSILIE